MLTARTVLASIRGELLVLRKWRVIWALLALPPVLNFLPYLSGYVLYRTVIPAQWDTYGTPEDILRELLPGYVLYETTPQFSLVGLAVFTLLGATIAGGDWSRGTVTTTLLQTPTRLIALIGQVSAMLIAITVSVLATLAVGIASVEAILAMTPRAHELFEVATALPPAGELFRGLGVFLLIAATFALGGFLAGTALRNTGGAIAACLLYGVLLYPTLYLLGLEAGGPLRALLDALPDTAAVSITSTFGENVGGSPNSMYYVVNPTVSVFIVAAYAIAFSAVTTALTLRRDVETATVRLRRARRSVSDGERPRRPIESSRQTKTRLAATRSDLYVLARRPAAWVFVLALPIYVLLSSYVVQYVFYLNADTGVIQGMSSFSVLQTLLPDHVLGVILNDLGGVGGIDGTSPFLILGALITGSAWGQRTITTSLLQAPGRTRSALGQMGVLALLAALSIAATFAVAFASTAAVGLIVRGVIDPPTNPWPSPLTALTAAATAAVIAVTYAFAGAALGALFRSAGGGIAAALLWTQVIKGTIDSVAARIPGAVHSIAEVLPNAATTTLTQIFGVAQPDLIDPNVAHAATGAALPLLLGYLALFAAIPVALTARRDIT